MCQESGPCQDATCQLSIWKIHGCQTSERKDKQFLTQSRGKILRPSSLVWLPGFRGQTGNAQWGQYHVAYVKLLVPRYESEGPKRETCQSVIRLNKTNHSLMKDGDPCCEAGGDVNVDPILRNTKEEKRTSWSPLDAGAQLVCGLHTFQNILQWLGIYIFAQIRQNSTWTNWVFNPLVMTWWKIISLTAQCSDMLDVCSNKKKWGLIIRYSHLFNSLPKAVSNTIIRLLITFSIETHPKY